MRKYARAINATLVILIVLIGVYMWIGNSTHNRAMEHADRADDYYLKKDYSNAIDEYKQSLQITPNKDIQFILGTTLMKAGRRDEAIAVMKELAAENDRVGKSAQNVLGAWNRKPQ